MELRSQAFLGRFGALRPDEDEAGAQRATWHEDGRVLRVRLLPPLSDDGTRLLLKELRRALAIEHPDLASVVDVGVEQGRIYVAEERPSGRRLDAVIAADGPLPVDGALSCMARLGAALIRVTREGLVHDGLRPEAVWLDGAGGVRLSRLGLAWAGPQARGDEAWSALLTAGTPYEAPERGGQFKPSEESDVFALGALLFLLLTGRNPPPLAAMDGRRWREQRLPELLAKHGGGLSRLVVDCVAGAMEKDPARRIATVEAFRGRLGRAMRAMSDGTGPSLADGGSSPAGTGSSSADVGPSPAGTGSSSVDAGPVSAGNASSSVREEASSSLTVTRSPAEAGKNGMPLRHAFFLGAGLAFLVFLSVYTAALRDGPDGGAGPALRAEGGAVAGLDVTAGLRRVLFEIADGDEALRRIELRRAQADGEGPVVARVEDRGRGRRPLLVEGLQEGTPYAWTLFVADRPVGRGTVTTRLFRLDGPFWELFSGRFSARWTASIPMAAGVRWIEGREATEHAVPGRSREGRFDLFGVDDEKEHRFLLELSNELGEKRIADAVSVPSYVSLVRERVAAFEKALQAIPVGPLLRKIEGMVADERDPGRLRRKVGELLAAAERDVALADRLGALAPHLPYFFDSPTVALGERLALERALAGVDRINGLCRHAGLGLGIGLAALERQRLRPAARPLVDGDRADAIRVRGGLDLAPESEARRGQAHLRVPGGVSLGQAFLRVRLSSFRWPACLRLTREGTDWLLLVADGRDGGAVDVDMPLRAEGLAGTVRYELALFSARDGEDEAVEARLEGVEFLARIEGGASR